MKFNLIILILFQAFLLNAQQSFDDYLEEIRLNNIQLKTAEKLVYVESLESQTGYFLPNPEISFARLGFGTEYLSEIVISQSFDYPTVYKYKRNSAEIEQNRSKGQYEQVQLGLLEEAGLLYIQHIHFNRKLNLLGILDSLMNKLQNEAERKLELGETNILEVNRIKSELALYRAENQLLRADLQDVQLQIVTLNGGQAMDFENFEYPELLDEIQPDSLVNRILQNHPIQSAWRTEMRMAENDIQLKKALNLPKFEFGYRQDNSPGEVLRGVHAGLSVPLFENKGVVEAAESRQLYLNDEYSSETHTLGNKIKRLVSEYQSIERSLEQLERIVSSMNTVDLIVRAYQAGQITYNEFLAEYNNYWQSLSYMEELRLSTALIKARLYVLYRN